MPFHDIPSMEVSTWACPATQASYRGGIMVETRDIPWPMPDGSLARLGLKLITVDPDQITIFVISYKRDEIRNHYRETNKVRSLPLNGR